MNILIKGQVRLATNLIYLIYIYIADLNFQVIFWLLVTLGAILNYSLFLCTSLNSALTTSLVGVAKSSVQTLLGFFTFGGVSYQPWNVAGKRLFIWLHFLLL